MQKSKEKVFFRNDPEFTDITPSQMVQKRGDPFFLDLTEENIDVFGYFFALLDKDEISQRGIKVAERIIESFPSHYTAWWYKYHILEKLPYDFTSECNFIEQILKENPKSYQAWHYRQWLVDRENECPDQILFLNETFAIDAKNFHAWSFSIWYSERWNKYQDVYDLSLRQIQLDVRNNSAWNTRMTIGQKLNVDLSKEFDDAEKSFDVVGKNEAACNFLMGIVDKQPELIERLKPLAMKMIAKHQDNVQAYRLLLYIANINNNQDEINTVCDQLMKFDPIRISYYTMLKSGNLKFQ